MSGREKIVLFDIDYTVFNTDAYREKIKQSFAKTLGIPLNDMDALLAIASKTTREKEGHFHPETFLREILSSSNKDLPPDALEDAFWSEELYKDSIYDEVESVFHTLSKHGVRIGIISTGNTKHQRHKIHMLKDLLRDEHIHIFIDKIPKLQEVVKKYHSYEIFIVDDLKTVLATAKSSDARVKTIHVTKQKKTEMKEAEVAFSPDCTVSNLHDIIPVVIKA